MSHPSPHPADDSGPSDLDAGTSRRAQAESSAAAPLADQPGGPDEHSASASEQTGAFPTGSRQANLPHSPAVTGERIHSGMGGILDWAVGEADEEPQDDDLADTVDVSSTVDELVVYLDGQLDDAQRRRVEQRLIDEATARENLAALQNSWDALDCLPRPTCSNDFTESTMRLVVQKELATRPAGKIVRRVLGWAGLAATLLFSLGMGYLVTQRWQSAEEREFFESYRLVRDWEKYQLIGDFEFLLRLEKDGVFAREVSHVEP